MRDIDVRRALRLEMKRLHEDDLDTLLIEELGLCQGTARVDFAIVNGTIHGYEIKSERDTLSRLPAQSAVYNQALEFVTIVAAQGHLSTIRRVVPDWWGLQVVLGHDADLTIECLRKPERNPAINPLALAQLLWRDEALQILSDHGFSSGMISKPRAELWNRLAAEFSINELGRMTRECLKRRGDAWRSLVTQA